LVDRRARRTSERSIQRTYVKASFAALLKRLGELAPVAGIALDHLVGYGTGKMFTVGAKWSGSVAADMVSGPTLDELRETLKARLRSLQEQRILVVIDDLDRLTPREAVEMVSLIKSLGDLPNVIYLLSYDESNLAKLIKKGAKVKGREFLRKIVQYAVHLPLPEGDNLIALLNADLETLLGEISPEDQQRLGITWHFIFRHYLRTPRDVRLYINAVAIALSAERDHVDVVDLLLLELLRLYESQLYGWIRNNLVELTQ
jgi:predicted KAP-like P-loop ATPase